MAQQFQVLRCCSCNIFQVQQIKKSKKWNCKICDEKQSILRVFGQGSGADCRSHVQKLNLLQGEQDQTPVNELGCKEESVGDGNVAVNIKEKLGWQDNIHSATATAESCGDGLCDSVITATEDHMLQRNNQQSKSRLTGVSKWNKFLLSDKSYNIGATTTTTRSERQRTSVETPAVGRTDETAATSSAVCDNWHLEPEQDVATPFDRAEEVSNPDHLALDRILRRNSKHPAAFATCQGKAPPAEFTTSARSLATTKSNSLYGSLFSTGEDFDDDI